VREGSGRREAGRGRGEGGRGGEKRSEGGAGGEGKRACGGENEWEGRGESDAVEREGSCGAGWGRAGGRWPTCAKPSWL